MVKQSVLFLNRFYQQKLNDRAYQFGDSAAKSKLQFASTSTMTRERLTDDRLPKAPKRGVQSR
jgi:hypothetical protein